MMSTGFMVLNASLQASTTVASVSVVYELVPVMGPDDK